MPYPPQGQSGAAIPSGVILMWAGTIAKIPSGYVICDGNNSTPNLLATFVEGVATAATNPGATGGSLAKTTAGHYHGLTSGSGESGGSVISSQTTTVTDSISDIRPPYYDIAFIMKT